MLEALGIVLLVLILSCMGGILFLLGLCVHKVRKFSRKVRSATNR